MKKNFNNIILLFLLFIFILLFKYNKTIQVSILNSITLWLHNLVPFILSMYLITDLLLNYGLSKWCYKIFKNNRVILIIVSMLLGTPANALYIKDFYKDGYISLNEANWLLTFSYSPNPLFILGISPNKKYALISLSLLYLTNLIIAVFMHSMLESTNVPFKEFKTKSFSSCLENSIFKSFDTLILILGIIIVYGIINTFIDILVPNTHAFIRSLIEMTNALNIIVKGNSKFYKWMFFAIVFGGLSIHTQIKSILSDTDISYKYFLFGRIIASIFVLIFIFIF